MATIKDLLSTFGEAPNREFGSAGLWWGTITNPVPAVETDPMYVVIPDIDVHTRWGPCKWMPRSKSQVVNVAEGIEAVHNITVSVSVMPTKGEQALVVFDNRQNPWVIAWQ